MMLIDSLLILLGVHQSTLERLSLANLGLCAHWLLLNRLLWLVTIIFRWVIRYRRVVSEFGREVLSFSFSPAMSWPP